MDKKYHDALKRLGNDVSSMVLLWDGVPQLLSALHHAKVLLSEEKETLDEKLKCDDEPKEVISTLFDSYLSKKSNKEFEKVMEILGKDFPPVKENLTCFLHNPMPPALLKLPSLLARKYYRTLIYYCRDLEDCWKWLLEDGRFTINQIFVPLEMVTAQPVSMAGQAIRSYEDLFRLLTGPRGKRNTHLILEGDAGTGKSTYVAKLALDWVSNDSSCMSEMFDLVAMVKLGEVIESATFEEMLYESFTNERDIIRLICETLGRAKSRVLLIFDSYDMVSPKAKPEVDRILEGRRFPHVTCLTTTRQSACATIPRTASVTVVIEGLSKESVDIYIEKRFVVAFVRKEFMKNPWLREMTRVPVLLCLFCSFNHRHLIDLTEELFGIIDHTVNYLVARHKDSLGRHYVPIEKDKIWLEAGMYAASELRKTHEYCTLPEVPTTATLHESLAKIAELGIFWSHTKRNARDFVTEVGYQFPHRLFQEYFAARFMAHSPPHLQWILDAIHEVHRSLQETNLHGSCLCLQPVSYMLSAHSQAYSDRLFPALTLVTTDDKSIMWIPWIYVNNFPKKKIQQKDSVFVRGSDKPAIDELVMNLILQNDPVYLNLRNVTLSSSVTWAPSVKKLEFSNCHLLNQQFPSLPQLKVSAMHDSTIDYKSLMTLMEGGKALEELTFGLKLCTGVPWPVSVKKLEFVDSRVENQQFPAPPNGPRQLECLKIHEDCSFDEVSLRTLAQSLKETETLKELSISLNYVDKVQQSLQLRFLSSLLAETKVAESLQTLRVWQIRLVPERVTFLTSLRHLQRLKQLVVRTSRNEYLSQIEIDAVASALLAGHINPTLEELTVANDGSSVCNLTTDSLFNALITLRRLKTLSLSGLVLSSSAIRQLEFKGISGYFGGQIR